MMKRFRTYIGLLAVVLCGVLALAGWDTNAADCESATVPTVCPSAIGDMGCIRERAALPTAAVENPRTGARLGHSRPVRCQPTQGKNPRRQSGGFLSSVHLPTGAASRLVCLVATRGGRCPWVPIRARFYYVIALERFLC